VEQASSWREPAGVRKGQPVDLAISATATELLLGAGRAILSSDDGTTWQRIDAQPALSLGTGPDVFAVLSSPAGPALLDRSGGFRFRSAHGAESLLGPESLIAALGTMVVLAVPGVGAALSTDRGDSFLRIAGSGTVSAVAVGEAQGQPLAFLALHRAAAERTDLVCADGEGALRRVGEVLASDGDESDEETERVAALLWDADGGQLIAAGAFGVRGWRPPDA
jgi:hypothetical protein